MDAPLVSLVLSKNAALLSNKNVHWAQIASIWNIISTDPPIIDETGNAFSNGDLVEHIRALKHDGIKVAPRAFAYPADEHLDYIGDKWWWPVASDTTSTVDAMVTNALARLNATYLPIYQRFNKPVLFAELAFYSAHSSAMQTYSVYSPEISPFDPETTSVSSAWQEQADAYEAVLWAMAQTNWVQGVYPFGNFYYDFDEKGYSIQGKTAREVMSQIYNRINQ